MIKIVRKERHYIDYIDEYEVPEETYREFFTDGEVELSADLWEALESFHVSRQIDEISNRTGDFELDVDIQVANGDC